MIFIVIAVLASLIVNGYYFNYIDSNVYLVYLNKIENPLLYPKDYLFNQSQHTYSLLNYLIVFIKKSTGINYQWLYFLFFLITLYFLYLAIYKLTFLLSKNHFSGQLAVAFFILPKWVASIGNFTHARFFTYRDLGLAIVLFSIILLLKKRFFLSLTLIIVAFSINPTLIPPLVLFWYFLIPLKNKKIITFSFLSLLLFAILIYIPKANLDLFLNKEWFLIMQERGEYSFPFLWKHFGWLNLFLYLFLFFTTLFFSKKKFFGKYQKKIFLFMGICIFLFIFHLVISSIVPISFLIQFQLLRSLVYICTFSLIAFAIFCSYSIKKNLIPTIIMIFFVYFWGDHLTVWHFIAAFAFFMYLIFPFKIEFKREYLKNKIKNTQIYTLIFLIIFAHFSYTVIFKKPQIYLPYYIATPTFYENFDSYRYWQWMEIQDWAKKNTSIHSVFLTPPYLEGFRVMSERSTTGESKDGSVIFYSSKYAKEWKQRSEMLNLYYKNNFDKMMELKDKIPFDYLITEKSKPSPNFNKIFENSLYSIYLAD